MENDRVASPKSVFINLNFAGHAGDSKTTEQIFSSNAAFGILTNDLVTIMEHEEVRTVTAFFISSLIF